MEAKEKNVTYLCTDAGHQIFNSILSYSGNILSKDNYKIFVQCNVIGCPGSVFNKEKK
jgi:hypothetical protein